MSYILGVHYISNICIRKVRINLYGNILEDITDYVLEHGKVSRSCGKHVTI